MSLTNVTFHQSELSEMTFDQPFDAAFGRYVLCFQPDPVSLLRRNANLLRPGGVILFHEPDRAQMRSFPPAPTYDRCCRWLSEVYRRSGVDAWIGVKLHSLFMAAGLPGPQMRMHAVIGGSDALYEIHLDADQAVTLAREIERLGVATASELGIETLVERIARKCPQTKASSSAVRRLGLGRTCSVPRGSVRIFRRIGATREGNICPACASVCLRPAPSNRRAVKRIGARTGYADQAAFTRQFHKSVGLA
jgi:hypothetical protein